MKSAIVLIFGLGIAIPSFAGTGTTGLADWCFNVNGSVDPSVVTDNPSNACNGGTNAALPAVQLGAFDTTLEQVDAFGNPIPSTANNLGSAVISFAGGTSYISAYMDYDLDFFGTACGGGTCGSYDDFANVVGSLPSGWAYELDDPNVSNIFSDFAAGALLDDNNVGTAGTNPQCCDVSWALQVGNLPTQGGTVTFNVSTAAPAGGFYLQQTSTTGGDSIYLTATVTPAQVSGVPEPATFGLALASLAGLGVLFVAMRRKRARV